MTNPPGVLARDGDLLIRGMRDDPADYALLARWLTDERVLEFYHGRDNPYPYERVVAKYGPRTRGEDPEGVVACLIVHRGRETGYMQHYPARAEAYDLEDAEGTHAIDMFIGEPERWDGGLGSRTLSALAGYLFERLGARRVIIDPHLDNARAIRAYEKAGFRKVKVLRAHEIHEGALRDSWLMVRGQPSRPLGHDG